MSHKQALVQRQIYKYDNKLTNFKQHETIENPRTSISNVSNTGRPPTNLPQNLENIKQAYYSKMQVLT